MKLEESFRKALSSVGKLHEFPIIVQYEDGEFDCLPSAALKDMFYDGDPYEVIYALRDLSFLDAPQAGSKEAQQAATDLTDEAIHQLLDRLNIAGVL
jgi:hypothetical protein